MKRRLTRKNKRRKKQLIIFSTICLLLVMASGYAAFSTNLSLTAKGNIKEKSRVIRAWSFTDQADFHTDFYREYIVNVTFLDNNKVPSNATESWNISEDEKHGGVIAYVVPNSNDNTKYDLYIGAKGGVIANEDSSYLFYNFRNVKEINFYDNFDTSYTVNMRNMFQFCTNISTIDLSSFDTGNVINMSNMFQMFINDTSTVLENKLTNIIFGDKFTVKNVSNMSQMFVGCNKLQLIDVSNWDTSNVENMMSVFALCSNLTEIDVSSWNTSKVTNMSFLFANCTSLKSLDLKNFNTSNVTDMKHMFRSCSSLTSLNLCSFDTRKVTDMERMFSGINNINYIYVGSNFETKQANTNAMFDSSSISSLTYGMC